MIESSPKTRRTKMPSTSISKASASKKVIVDFPDALYQDMQRAVHEFSVKRSVLIREAVGEYLRRRARRKLAGELADGYRANAALNQQISEEFIHVDAENL